LAVALGCGAIAASGDGGAPTATEAVAFVRAVNLQPSDLPGSAPFQSEAGSPPNASELQRVLHCGHKGRPRGRTLAAERSVLADSRGHEIVEIVGSLVIVMPSETLAKAEIANLTKRGGRECLEHDLRVSTIGSRGPKAPAYSLRFTLVPVAPALGHEAVDIHLVARLQRERRASRTPSSPQPKFSSTGETIFRVGDADIAFITMSLRRELPQAIEAHLLAALHSRAEAQPL
jgi:hypothetical protein